MDGLPIYGTYYLNRLVERLVPEPRFFLDKFFPGTPVFSNSEFIFFDQVPGRKTGFAPFVHPLNEAPMIRGQGHRTRFFKPAYIKEKTDLTPDRGFNRMPGEGFGGEMSPMQRLEQLLIRDVKRLKDRWSNRLESMAAEVVKTGLLTIQGDGIEALLDFERHESLGLTLKGTDSWANPDFDMTAFLELRQTNMARLNLRQVRPKNLIMHPSSYNYFTKNKQVLTLLDSIKRNAELAVKLTPGVQSFESLVYKGEIGDIKLYVYDAIAEDGQPFIGVNQALLCCDDIDGIKFFGCVHDLDAEVAPYEIFMKSWKTQDPSQRLVLLQSAPLLGTFDPNTAELLTVAS